MLYSRSIVQKRYRKLTLHALYSLTELMKYSACINEALRNPREYIIAVSSTILYWSSTFFHHRADNMNLMQKTLVQQFGCNNTITIIPVLCSMLVKNQTQWVTWTNHPSLALLLSAHACTTNMADTEKHWQRFRSLFCIITDLTQLA